MGVDKARMAELTSGLPSKSAKMRALAKAGYTRGDIARFLGTRYQFVRNVLMQDEAKRAETKSETHSVETSLDKCSPPKRVRVAPDGEVALPAAFAQALGLKPGDVLFARVEAGEIRLLTPRAAMARAHAIIRQFVPEGVSLVDELIEERRREAQRELSDG